MIFEISYKLILQIAAGLSFSHKRAILHRDVKPANILLKANGEPRLADFGTGSLY
ncbi:MAG: protein kinase [Deinococcales bacterium]